MGVIICISCLLILAAGRYSLLQELQEAEKKRSDRD